MSASIIAMVVLVLAPPVSADTAYSEDCWVEFEYGNQNPPLQHDQKYDGQPWQPESNTSQDDVFWGDGDDVNISLELVLNNTHNLQKPFDFKFMITVAANPNQYKIIEGSNYTQNQDYENNVTLDYQDSDTRYIYVEVYEVDILDHIEVSVIVEVWDGLVQEDRRYCSYSWVDPVE